MHLISYASDRRDLRAAGACLGQILRRAPAVTLSDRGRSRESTGAARSLPRFGLRSWVCVLAWHWLNSWGRREALQWRKRYRSRTLWERQRPPSDARGEGNQGARRSSCHHRRPFPPRPSGPRIIASPVGFPDRRSLIGLRRKPLQALLGIKPNIWTLFPLCLLSFLLFPSAKKLKTKPESRRPSPTRGLKARRGNRKLSFLSASQSSVRDISEAPHPP